MDQFIACSPLEDTRRGVAAQGNTNTSAGRTGRDAAETLSQMVSDLHGLGPTWSWAYMVLGDYFSAQRLDVAFDWHPCRTHYLDRRRTCLNQLGLDRRSYPLPYWVTSRSRPPERS